MEQFKEHHSESVQLCIDMDKKLYSFKSTFQMIEVFYNHELGNILTLDGYLMITEKDEFIYHDMIVHVPMAVNQLIKRVLVIGGGDGGTVRELCRYANIEHIDMVEIDQEVVDVCIKYFPNSTKGLSDPRVKLYFEDGCHFVAQKHSAYDLIIVDSTDPFSVGEGLFTSEFYKDCYEALSENGILVNQHESPFYDNYKRNMQRAHKRIKESFMIAEVYQAFIPTYASGHWLFGFASKTFHPINDFSPDLWLNHQLKTRYYNPSVHIAAFALPNYVIESLVENL